MKKILNCCVGLMALLSVAALGHAQDTESAKPAAAAVVQTPGLSDAQPSASDLTAPPVPVAAPSAAETPAAITGFSLDHCSGCGQVLPLIPYVSANPCGSINPCSPIPVMVSTGSHCQPCGSPMVQIAAFPTTDCGFDSPVTLANYQEAVPTGSAAVTQESENVIVSPPPFENSAIVTEAPVYQTSPTIDGAQSYNPVPVLDSNVSGLNSMPTGVPTMSSTIPMSTDVTGSGCVGCESTSGGMMYSSPVVGRGGALFGSRPMNRTRGVVGGRIFRRH